MNSAVTPELPRDRARAEATLTDHLERYLAIEDILDIPSGNDSFEIGRVDSIATEQQIDAKADELQKAWDLGMEPVPRLCALLEDRGIKVVEANLPEHINGLACHVLRDGTPVADAMVVSSRTKVERKRFILARELAHRIIRSTGNPAIKLEHVGGQEGNKQASNASKKQKQGRGTVGKARVT